MSDLSRAVATAFAQRRKELGLSLDEVGKRSRLHRTTVGLVERSQRAPTLDSAYRLAVALDLRLSTLVADFERTQGQGRDSQT